MTLEAGIKFSIIISNFSIFPVYPQYIPSCTFVRQDSNCARIGCCCFSRPRASERFSQGAKTTKVVLGLILRIDIYGKLHGISILRWMFNHVWPTSGDLHEKKMRGLGLILLVTAPISISKIRSNLRSTTFRYYHLHKQLDFNQNGEFCAAKLGFKQQHDTSSILTLANKAEGNN